MIKKGHTNATNICISPITQANLVIILVKNIITNFIYSVLSILFLNFRKISITNYEFCTQFLQIIGGILPSIILIFLLKWRKYLWSKNNPLQSSLKKLQNAADQLGEYQKLFDKACQINFGM